MKRYITMPVFFRPVIVKILAGLYLVAISGAQSLCAQNTTLSSSPVLHAYFEIKNALVNSNADSTSLRAVEFVGAISSHDFKSLKGADTPPDIELQKKMISDADHIANSKDLSVQRQYFASLSQTLYELIKNVRLSSQVFYQMYCPMKKQYWLSEESTVRNPYFGKAMLTCGSVTEMIKL
jgi:Protein of unknown function (DUF3347)